MVVLVDVLRRDPGGVAAVRSVCTCVCVLFCGFGLTWLGRTYVAHESGIRKGRRDQKAASDCEEPSDRIDT